MSRFNFDEFMAAEKAGNNPTRNTSSGGGVQYFALKNDGDEAIVRFDYSTVDEIQLINVHSLKIDEKYRKVECLRSPLEPIDTCPLCQSGNKVYTKMYCRLIEYVKQQDGTIRPESRIWERKGDFAKTLVGLMNDYGDLREAVFKVRRQGKAGDTNTIYTVNFLNPAMYTKEMYKPDFSGFSNYSLNAYAVWKKSAQEMVAYIETGKFPQPDVKQTVKEAIPTATTAQPAVATMPTAAVQSAPAQVRPAVQPTPVPYTGNTTTRVNRVADNGIDDTIDPTQRVRRYTYE